MSSRTLRDTVMGALIGGLLLGGAALWRTLAEGGVPDPVGLWGFTSALGVIVGALVGPLVGAAVRRRRDDYSS